MSVTGKKISGLDPGSLPLTGSELIPVVQGGANRKVTAQDISNLGPSDILGAIAFDAPAPTPGKSGKYSFTTGGSCTWLTGGAATVAVGDEVVVVFTAPSTYTYTKVGRPDIEQVRSQSTTKVPSSKLVDDELNAIGSILDGEPIPTNYSILPLLVSGYAYYGTTGLYAALTGWSSLLIVVANVSLPIVNNKIYLKETQCKPNNFVCYTSSTVFNSSTKISDTEPVPLIDGFYEITIPANCLSIAVNFKNTLNTYQVLDLYNSKVENQTEGGLIRKVSALEVDVLEVQNSVDAKINLSDIEQTRSQSTSKVPSSKLVDDELSAIDSILDGTTITTNYNILPLLVSENVYFGTDGRYGPLVNWKSILIKISDIPLTITNNKLYLKATNCKPNNFVSYTSSTIFNSSTKISSIEPVPLIDGFYEITIQSNCVSIGINFQDTYNTYQTLNLYVDKSENIILDGLVQKVAVIEPKVAALELDVAADESRITAIEEIINQIENPPIALSSTTNSTMLKGRNIWATNSEVIVYEENGSGMLVNMFFAGDFTNMPLTELRVESDGIISLSGTIFELIGFMSHNTDINRVTTQLFGKIGSQNGIFMNYKIPFSTNIKVYLKKATGVTNPQFWFSAKTISAKKISISGIDLPSTAKLKCYNLQTQLNAGEYHDVLNTTKNGAILGVFFKGIPVSGTSESYLEACVRAFVGGSSTPVKISSGLEDYFLGTYYFNTGIYYNDNSGMTKRASGEISAFRLHINDPWLFSTGGYKVNIRCGETEDGSESGNLYMNPQPTIYKTIALVYEWD